jgi:hypothetical protein
MTTLDFVDTPTSSGAASPSTIATASTIATLSRFGIRLIQLHDELWRVTRNSGEVLGYIESFLDRGTPRFRAKRMFSAQRPSLPLGEFWVLDDAVDCFRFS